MRSEDAIRERIEYAEEDFEPGKYLSEDVKAAREAGFLQALKWVVGGDD